MTLNKFVFKITPQTKVDVTQHTFKLFVIPEICQKGRGHKGCVQYKRTGLCPHTLSAQGRYMKKRLEKYNDYKSTLLAMAKKMGFDLPGYGFSMYFFIPIPRRWSKKDRKAMHGQMHFRKPDLDNMEKAVYDSLTFKDEQIAQLSGHGKFWVDTRIGDGIKDPIGPGWIEIITGHEPYNPFGVEWVDQSKIISLKATMDYKKRSANDNVRTYKKKRKNDTLR